MDYRISSFFIRLIRLRKERMTGTIKAATSPPANPLLYRFIPLYTIPTFNATEECRKPATRPAKTPNSPAMGARVVENSKASRGAGSLMDQCFVRLARYTPIMIGAIFLRCFPVEENPTIEKSPRWSVRSDRRPQPAQNLWRTDR